ncbi:hypothetical protein JW998_12785 [candidate division KSB1 bacterium]|nr:hypothetical protein [candidate division KSB1 bacterium]
MYARFLCLLIFFVFTNSSWSNPINSRTGSDSLLGKQPISSDSKSFKSERAADSNRYCIWIMQGNNRILVNTISPHDITSLAFSPLPGTNLPGFNFSYIKEKDDYDDGSIFVQLFFKLGAKYLYFKGGVDVFYVIDPEDGPGGGILPCAEIGLGKLNKIYLSAGILNDLFFGMKSINLHYVFEDNLSSLMIGQAFGDDGNYQGFAYKIDCRLWRAMVIRVQGNAHFARKLFGQQIGLGIAF